MTFPKECSAEHSRCTSRKGNSGEICWENAKNCVFGFVILWVFSQAKNKTKQTNKNGHFQEVIIADRLNLFDQRI